MIFKEKDMDLVLDGMGIVFYSPETNKNIPKGYDFFEEEYQKPEDVAKHIKKGELESGDPRGTDRPHRSGILSYHIMHKTA